VSRQVLDELKQQIPLLDYLQAHDWRPARQLSRGRLMGLCPLHSDHKPSVLVDPGKSLFYCYGCGRGGDVIRFVELYRQVKIPQALALLHQWRGMAPLLHQATGFYRMQLHRHGEAVAYLYQRGLRSPKLIEHMRIGYAPGGGLRRWLTQLGYPVESKYWNVSKGWRSMMDSGHGGHKELAAVAGICDGIDQSGSAVAKRVPGGRESPPQIPDQRALAVVGW